MSFDAVVTNPGRLTILTALAVEERQEFVQLRRATSLTDGNLSAHARRLETAGLVGIDKQFRAGKPVTSIILTPAGRAALESHTRRLLAAISHRRVGSTATTSSQERSMTSSAVTAAPRTLFLAQVTSDPAVVDEEAAADDWID